jgi:hypothetical protein
MAQQTLVRDPLCSRVISMAMVAEEPLREFQPHHICATACLQGHSNTMMACLALERKSLTQNLELTALTMLSANGRIELSVPYTSVSNT